MNQDNNQLEVTLKSLLERVNITEPELSRRVGVGIRIINDWKQRRKIPRLDNAASLARELGVPMKTLAIALGIDVSGIPDDTDC